MKRITVLAGLLLLLVLWSASVTSASPPAQEPIGAGNPQDRDGPLPPIGAAGIVPAPQADDTHFVVYEGPYMDRYLFRSDVPNGRLTFDIPITRYYSPLITPVNLDSNGFLKPAIRQQLINSRVLPAAARLRLHVFDVDEEVPAPYCPEVDLIYVNGNPIHAKLSGANQTWSSPSFVVPIGMLKFPTTLRSGGFPPVPVNNTISIDIDTQCFNLWAVEVDWAVLEIPTLIRPIVFAHGWVGDMHTFDIFEGFAITDGIPSAGQVDLRRGIEPISNTSPLLARYIVEAARQFGVDKVNIFAHSKGGLVSRHALRSWDVASKVDHLVTFGSPHHGTDWMDVVANVMCNANFVPFSTERNKCFSAARELKVDAIRDNFNYQGCTLVSSNPEIWIGCLPRYFQQPSVDYRTLVGAISDVGVASATYPWASDWIPYPILGYVDYAFLNPLISHMNIHKDKGAYCRSLSYIAPNILSPTCNGVTPTGIIVTDIGNAPIWPDNQFQTVSKTSGNLPAGGNTTLFVTIDASEQVLFDVFTTNELTSFTLQNPSGGSITPSTSGAIHATQKLDSSGWWYQYSINNPTAGTWQLHLNALSAADYSSNVAVKSGTKFSVKTNKYTYNYNELVTVEATLVNNTTPLLGSTINLLVTRPDNSTLNIILVDNGSNGDVTANDGIYTTRFNSSTVTGHHRLSLSAVNGQINRLVETSIAVTAQTAQIQSVTSATPVDTNGNGLYDVFRLNLSLNVLTAGHFEVTGILVDTNGNPIASASYATLRDGTGPLSPGIQTIPLIFSGAAIRTRGVNGPYKLTNVLVQDQNISSLQVDLAQNVYTTSAYQANQFEGDLLTLGNNSETPIDTNGNSLYDILRITLNINVLNPGTYQLNGRLIDPNGDEIAWGSASFIASSSGSYLAQIEFDGKTIREHGVNGPYTLQDLSVANTTGIGSKIFDKAYTTRAYNYIQFEPIPRNTYLPLIVKNYTPGSQPPATGFNSQFNGNTSGWQSHSGTWTVDANFYSTTGVASAWAGASYNANFTNFDYQAKLWRYGCNTCANRLLIRAAPTPLNSINDWYSYYSFNYTTGGYYSVWKRVAGGAATALQNWTYSSAIVQGSAWNTLRVVASGTSLRLYINGTPVWTGTDSALTAGRVGLGMYKDTSSGNQLFVDWATLAKLGATALETLAADSLSSEQQALNDEANQRGGGSEAMAPSD